MATPFFLYNDLMGRIQDTSDLSVAEKRECVRNILGCNGQGHELVYALIKAYHTETNNGVGSLTIPYGGKKQRKNLVFDLDELPARLKRIIAEFVGMHVTKMNEEAEIHKLQSPDNI